MEIDSLFWMAFQSSLILGLVHGVNPCGHSWLILAPFVVGEKNGGRVAWLTTSFLAGTVVACLVLGMSLGAVSALIPDSFQFWADVGTASILVVLGVVLIIKPGLIHQHHHDTHGHDHAYDLEHLHPHAEEKKQKLTGMALFGIGFVNMIIPCPTVAIMYKYALDSASALKATVIFGIYAAATAIAVGGVIYLIFRVTRILEKLSQDWVEAALMRSAGVVTVIFGGYSLSTYVG
ncbi:MAG: sulfite exporter TauE/SafE family protein [Desulfuromonas sp.]